MDRSMKMKSLMRKSMTKLSICVAILLLLATPLFYLLTKNYYAEDMIDIIESVRNGDPVPSLDLEEDIIHGILIQFVLFATIFGIAILLTSRFISKKLWKPFDETLDAMESFSLEKGTIPTLPETDVKEFARLNSVLNKLMSDSLDSYRVQKEFTENASHELQTPLAVIQSKLDNLMQLPGMTKEQSVIIQDINEMSVRLSRLSRNLLLLAKIENKLFAFDEVDALRVVDDLYPYFISISNGLSIQKDFQTDSLTLKANKSLFESLVSNLVVNAIRHNEECGEVKIEVFEDKMIISNTSNEGPLDESRIFKRFYRSSGKSKGNGLGLAIVKSICDYHGWKIKYSYGNGWHQFIVYF
jgi:two-component system OmpR family sensor kinase